MGSGLFTWQWLLNGTPITGETNRIYSITGGAAVEFGKIPSGGGQRGGLCGKLERGGGGAVGEQRGNGEHDSFSNRISINPLLGPVLGNNTNATSEPGEPLHDGKPGGKSIWYTWRRVLPG